MPRTKHITLTPNQVVAYNLRRARLEHGWTQDEATKRLEPHLGTRWSRATYSAVENSVDSERIRRFDADDLLALSKAFERPISYFLLPPPPTYSIPGSAENWPYIKERLGRQPEGGWKEQTPKDQLTTTVAVRTPAGVTPSSELLERLLALDEPTTLRLRQLSAGLSPDDRRALQGQLKGRRGTLSASQLGNLGNHARDLRELADLLEGIQRELEPGEAS